MASVREQVIRKVAELPPLPVAVQKLCSLAGNAEADSDEMAEVISKDEALTIKILRIANSGFYGMSRQSNTVAEAIILLGLKELRSVALAFTVMDYDSKATVKCSLLREDLWKHSLSVANASRTIAQRFGVPNTEEIYVGALLHDIGKLVFMNHFAEKYNEVLARALDGQKTLPVLEKEAFGLNHAVLAHELCRHWKLPSSLCKMIDQHSIYVSDMDSSTIQDLICCSLEMGDCLSRMGQIGFDGDPVVGGEFLAVLEALEVDFGELHEMLSTTKEEARKAEKFFSLKGSRKIPDSPDRKAPMVGVVMKNDRALTIAKLVIDGMGYIPNSDMEIVTEKAPFLAVLVDDTPPEPLIESCTQLQVPVLNFAQWHKENNPSLRVSQYNVYRMEAWLGQKLTEFKAELLARGQAKS
jgi:putative nucleotidyltransferase with HDIG domain